MKTYTKVFILTVLASLFFGGIAQAQDEEVIYLADTMGDMDGLSAIYQVVIQNGVANMVLIENGLLPYNHIDALAAEPDGSKLWMVDDYKGGSSDSGTFMCYDVASATIHEVGVVTYNGARLFYVDQAAMAPDGTLYITDNTFNRLYTLDKETAVATLLGQVTTPDGVVVNIGGSDIAFTADGKLYLWVNLAVSGAPAGLYELEIPGVDGIVDAVWVGGAQDLDRRFTGFAVRDNGKGQLIGSVSGARASTFQNNIVLVDKATGLFVENYPMYKDGAPFKHMWGDMSIGPILLPPPPPPPPPPEVCTYTIGYWKTHAWDGRQVTILGLVVDETIGKKILWGAKGNTMSMLFAQLIAAKLNVDNAAGHAAIDGAEDFLAMLDDATGDVVVLDADGHLILNWNRSFDSDTVKTLSDYWKDLLDEFNNSNHCEEPVSAPTQSTLSNVEEPSGNPGNGKAAAKKPGKGRK